MVAHNVSLHENLVACKICITMYNARGLLISETCQEGTPVVGDKTGNIGGHFVFVILRAKNAKSSLVYGMFGISTQK